MATQSPTSQSQSQSQINKSTTQPEDSHPTSTPLTLPEPGHAAQTLDVSGSGTTVKLDHLGPMVVNADGSLSRISNWDGMADVERENTVRIIGKRNESRLKALGKKKAQGTDQEA